MQIEIRNTDQTATGLQKIPFAAPYALARYVAIFVAINVIKYDENWMPAPDQHTAVKFNPSDFFLHIV